MARLVAVGGILDGREFPIAGELVIGRAEDCEIVTHSPQASRRHARVFADSGGFAVEDLGSKNGTYVNGRTVKRHILSEGDEVAVGDQTFVFGAAGALGSKAPKVAPPAVRRRKPGLAESGIDVVQEAPEDLSAHNLSMRIDLKDLERQEERGDVESMRRSHERLRIMIEVSSALSTIHDLGALLEEIMKQLFEIFPQAERGFIMLSEGAGGSLVPRVVKRRGGASGAEAEKITVSEAVIKEVMSGPNSVLTSDAMSDERFLDRMSIVNLQIRSMMCVPLVVRDEVLGLIHIDTTSRSRSFVEEDLQLLAGVAAQAAVSIKNARLMDQVQREAATRGQLQRYLSPDLVDRIQRGEMKLEIGGSSAHGTVFFSDIIGFTAMSERMPPGEVVSLLNRYFHVMEEIIFRHGGTIDKFGGDSIMAFWGVLVQGERDALGAVSAAVEMQNALFAFNCELRAQGRQPVRMGIGLNTGDFVAGNIGSEQKIEFTVIGDAVNLAQRIESLAGRGQVLISPSTYEQVASETSVVAFEPVAVKGRSEPVRVYNVRSVRPAAAAARPGIILTVPVELTVKASGDTTQFSTAAQIVWGAPRPSAGSVVELEIVSERRLATGASCTLKPLIRGASIPTFDAQVLYASEAPAEEKGDSAAGGAMLVADAPPAEFARLLEPGSRAPAEKTLEELGRD